MSERRTLRVGGSTALLGASLIALALLLIVSAQAAPQNKPRVSASAGISNSNVLTVKGRVRPARTTWRVRVQARTFRVKSGRAKPVWVRRGDSARLGRSGRVRVAVPAGGNSAVVRV